MPYWSGDPTVHLEILHKVQRGICNVIGPLQASQLQSFSHWHDIASFCLFCKCFHGGCSDELFSLVPWIHEFKHLRLALRSHPFTVEIAKFNHHFYSNGSFVILSTCEALFHFCASLITTVLNLNAMSIIIFCLLEPCSSFIDSSILSFLSLLFHFHLL